MAASRASDDDRERVAGLLRAHLLAGRLTVEEFEERLAAAYRATTNAELDALSADLPAEHLASTRATGRRLPVGNRPFSLRIEAVEPPEVVISEAFRTLAPQLLRFGYRVDPPVESQVVFTRERRPQWTILVAVLAFPLGLLALLHRQSSQVVFSALSVGERRTLVDVVGVALAGARRAFLELER